LLKQINFFSKKKQQILIDKNGKALYSLVVIGCRRNKTAKITKGRERGMRGKGEILFAYEKAYNTKGKGSQTYAVGSMLKLNPCIIVRGSTALIAIGEGYCRSFVCVRV